MILFMSSLGIVIPHYNVNDNSLWLLYNLLDSIQRVEPTLLRSVVVSDDASPDLSDKDFATMLAPYGVTGIRRRKNDGYSKNVNHGLKFLLTHSIQYALILNNDITLTHKISPLFEYFRNIESLAVVGIRLWYPDGRLQHGGFECNSSKEMQHPFYRTWEGGLGTRFVGGVTGAFQLLDLNKVSLYPEEYSLSYEDVSFCLRTWQSGSRILYTDTISAIHNESSTRGYLLGVKEHESITAFHREHFQFPVIEENLRKAKECYPRELLQSILAPQPFLPYVRDSKTREERYSYPNRKAGWALARKHLKLAPVGLPPKG
jgi:GT2 family glycosyltransferase